MTNDKTDDNLDSVEAALDRFLAKQTPEMLATFAQRVQPVVTASTPKGDLNFFCPGKLPLWRAETLLSKEPETIEWIEGFEDGDVFWDIGANVGVYSLYAALLNKVKTYAFEPSAANYFILNRNIKVNHFAERVSAFCLALGDKTELSHLYMGDESEELGGALNQFGASVDWDGKPFKPVFTQGMLGYSIDDFIAAFDIDFPNHLKIDVDGIEDKVIGGCAKTLADSRVKSILIELNVERAEYSEGIISIIENSGFKLEARRHAEMFDSGPWSAFYNHIFVRAG